MRGLRYWWLRRRALRQGLFLYWDGLRWRLADPLQVVRRMVQLESQEELFSRALGDPGQVLSQLGEEALQQAAKILEVHRFDGRRGLTDLQLLRLLEQFAEWFSDQKKVVSVGLPGGHLRRSRLPPPPLSPPRPSRISCLRNLCQSSMDPSGWIPFVGNFPSYS